MFDNDDFDLDDDFLKDVVAKEEEENIKSQREKRDVSEYSQVKRRKLDCDDTFSDITLDDEPSFAKNTQQSSIGPDCLKGSRSELPRILQPSCISIVSSTNVTKSRKASALEVFEKASSKKSTSTENSPKPTNHCRPRGFSKAVKRLETTEDNRSNYSKNDKNREDKYIRKKSTTPKKMPRFLVREKNATLAPWQTVERRFPGPAGLLPDDLNMSIYTKNLSPRKMLSLLEPETEIETRVTDYCSQRTAALFSSGAWRLMLDDLPLNFLRDDTIENFKKMSHLQRENSSTSYIAGVVQRIDLRPANPRVLLKDMTGEIEATMNSDIIRTHTDVFEPGVVMLLHKPALLHFEDKEYGRKYHLMINLHNLLAVYSDKKRLISSPWMESRRPSDLAASLDSSETLKNEAEKTVAQRNISFEDNLGMDWSDDDPSAISRDIGESQNSVIENFASFGTADNNGGKKITTTVIIEQVDTQKTPVISISSEKMSLHPEKESNIEEIQTKGTKIRSKLLQFRSNDVLTPVQEDDKKTSSEADADIANSKVIEAGGNEELSTFGDHLLFGDDSDDEILSQLDVDAIAMTYSG